MTTYTVTTNNDAGPGSLRDAIDVTNSNPGPDEIAFASSFVIPVGALLPQLTGDLTITGGPTELLGALHTGGANLTLPTGLTLYGLQGTGSLSLDAELHISDGAGLTYAGDISGAGSLLMAGAVTFTLSGTNTFTGGVAVSGGTLVLSGGAAIADGARVTVTGGTLQLDTSETVGSIAGGGAIALSAGNLTTGGDNASTTFSGVISGAGNLTKTGSGALTLSGANTFTGDVTVSAGTVVLTGGSAIDDGARVIFGGGTLQLDASETVGSISGGGAIALGASNLTMAGDFWTTFTGVISGTGDLIKDGAGTLTLSGANTFTGDVTVSAGTLALVGGSSIDDASAVILDTGALRLDASETVGSIAGSGAITLGSGRLTAGDDNDTTLSGVISGAGGLTKTGTGTLTLEGVNTFTGAVTVSEGTLELTGGVAIADTVAVTVSGGTLEVVNAETVGSIAGAGVIHLIGDLFTGGDNTSTTFSGVISGSGGVVKTGTGTLTLSGANTHDGSHVSAGTLNVTGSLASATTIGGGATLTGTGTLGELTVNGTLAPGASPGILHTGKLNFGSSGVFAAEIGGVTAGLYDQVQVTGLVTLNGALNVSLFGGFTPSASGSYVLIANDGVDAIVGTFTGLTQGASLTVGGFNFVISYIGGDGNDVTLTYTAPAAPQPPEPSTIPTPSADVLSLPAAGGQMLALAGDDTVSGGAGADYVHGNQGDDQIAAGGGADTVLGGQGSDFIQGNQGNDLLFGDIGDDSLMGGQGDDYLHGNQGHDVLLGDLGNDTLLGGQGDDVIAGGEGADYLSGDLGDDVLTGGGGADIFNFVQGQGRDVVTDFSHAQGDHILLSISQAADFGALAAKMSMVGADTVLTLGTETIVLAGVQMASLTASDFMFA